MWNAFAAQPVGPLRGPFKNIKILLFHENSPISSGIPYTTELLHPTLGSLGCWSGIPRSRIGMVLWKPLHEHRIKITVVVESHPRSQTTICCSSHWIAASTYGSLDFSPSLRIKKGWNATLVQIIFCLAGRPTTIFSLLSESRGRRPAAS